MPGRVGSLRACRRCPAAVYRRHRAATVLTLAAAATAPHWPCIRLSLPVLSTFRDTRCTREPRAVCKPSIVRFAYAYPLPMQSPPRPPGGYIPFLSPLHGFGADAPTGLHVIHTGKHACVYLHRPASHAVQARWVHQGCPRCGDTPGAPDNGRRERAG